ncbi:hypothetical protein GCM10020295_31310 [Streptomyces cinereospinus]
MAALAWVAVVAVPVALGVRWWGCRKTAAEGLAHGATEVAAEDPTGVVPEDVTAGVVEDLTATGGVTGGRGGRT